MGLLTGDWGKNTDHCIEELRHTIMCQADTTVVTHDWVQGLVSPVPNQQNPRKCADWDAHWQWQLDRQVARPDKPLMKPKEGVYEVPAARPPPGYE